MSFLSFDTAKVRSVLNLSSIISSPRATVELFTYTKLKLNTDKSVEFQSMNDFVSFSSTVHTNNLEDLPQGVQFLIKTDLFHNAINLTSDPLVGMDLDLDKHAITIQGAKAKHNLRINTDLAENFTIPTPQGDAETSFSITVTDLQAVIRQGAVSLGNPRTVYQSEFLNYCFTVKKDGSILMVTTDRYRVTKMSVKAHKISTSIELDSKNYLIPPKLLGIIEKLDTTEELRVEFFSDTILVRTSTSIIIGRYGEGTFPDYDKILPASFAINFSLASNDLQDAIKQVQYFARMNNESKAVKLTVKPNDKKIILSSQTSDGYASEATLDIIKYEGPSDDWEQSFNIDYLAGFVSTLKETHILWEANPGKPSVLSPLNEKDTLLYLVSGLK